MKLAFHLVVGSLVAVSVLSTSALSVPPGGATQVAGRSTLSDAVEAGLNIGYEDATVEPRQGGKGKVPSIPGSGAAGRAQKYIEFTQHVMNIIEDTRPWTWTKEERGKWTKATVEKLSKEQPEFNWVICYTKHKTDFEGKEGIDWGHTQKKVETRLTHIIGRYVYHLYWFKKGTFERIGDGGWENWAYIGDVKNVSKDGRKITFGDNF